MRYFHRAHCSPETALEFARRFFAERGFTSVPAGSDGLRFTGPLGIVTVEVAVEGGHCTRVDAATAEVGESELDKRVKRFLAELHRVDDPAYSLRGAY